MSENNEYKGFRSLLSSRSKEPELDANAPFAGAGIFGYDPRVLQQVQREDQYILPEGQAHKRGRFEMAFTQIGGGCLSGGILGGTLGMRSGMQYVSGKELPKSVRNTQILNHVTKMAAEKGQAFGIIALMYSIFGVVVECRYSPLSQFENDDLNSVTAGTLTGLLFKCTGGLRSSLIGGGVGLGIAGLARLVYRELK
ncbi:mitochondrial import inner membrane translocase subunit Tim23-like [Mya arenaria]|uniref:mitochondrial import inner membrane translocase subunit Tim23-like n=1 Tax=Mya arenaria TaxID=6604 RepID=UPI0022E31656|nr:mitochondrial import inner membrane translocase subunit Tim23-like [Mya arenaria]